MGCVIMFLNAFTSEEVANAMVPTRQQLLVDSTCAEFLE